MYPTVRYSTLLRLQPAILQRHHRNHRPQLVTDRYCSVCRTARRQLTVELRYSLLLAAVYSMSNTTVARHTTVIIKNRYGNCRYTSSKTSSSSSTVRNIHHQEQRTTTTTTTAVQKVNVCYVDLRGFGISILERLVIEECLLKHDPCNRHWIICGTHTATPHKYLQLPAAAVPIRQQQQQLLEDESTSTKNDTVAIVMGIGGKPNDLLKVENVQRDHVSVMKRFTGGGTVVLDHNSIWTTIIGRPPSVEPDNNNHITDQPKQPLHFPRPIMEYTADTIYRPIFERLASKLQEQKTHPSTATSERTKTLVMDTKSCSFDHSGRMLTIPSNRSTKESRTVHASRSQSPSLSYTFALRENDYVLNHTTTNDDYKMGGNAQAITKNGFLHHTSFLWDYDIANMEDYLLLPNKRPQYRQNRSHTNFLLALQHIYPSLQKHDFFTAMSDTCQDVFDVQRMSLIDVMNIVNQQGGIQSWYETHSRTKIIQNL